MQARGLRLLGGALSVPRTQRLTRASSQISDRQLPEADGQEKTYGFWEYPTTVWQWPDMSLESEGVQAFLNFLRYVCIAFPLITIPWLEYQSRRIDVLQSHISMSERQHKQLTEKNRTYAAKIKQLTQQLNESTAAKETSVEDE
eukprot:TRINITY_DN55056_c0_g1_i1.p1 TRINITY_DN55056_c0_g1~~TRINITY_DN55056_c0_g1_i1.p1  ORF type:complete len:144 (-),score=22.59 TRINITY_DN55056_c0_g1_i1:173-604(-)